MILCGVKVRDEDIHTLIDLLMSFGRADDLELAGRIGHNLYVGSILLSLSPTEREILLDVLEDPPEGLAELRGALARDQGGGQ